MGRLARLRPVLTSHWTAAAGAFALLALILLWQALVGGRVLASTNTLYISVPFSFSAPHGWQDESNLLISDSPYYFIPMLELIRDRFHDGVLPLWNPDIMSGSPLLANQQSAAFSVFNLPLWVLPFESALGWAAALKLFFAGLGTYLFARRLKLGFWPSVVAGTAFALSGFMIVWLSSAHTNVVALLPWALLAVELVLAEASLRAVLALAAVTALYVLGGHPETSIFVGLATVLYAATRLALDPPAEGRRRRAALIGAGTVLGAGLAAVALLPFLDALHGSADRTVRGQELGTTPGASLLSILFPDYWGRPTGASVLGPSNFSERTFYAGAITLLLAGVALTVRGAPRRFAPLLVLGVVGLLGSTDATSSSAILGDLPLIGQTVIARMHVLFGFAVAVLGGAGLDALIRGRATIKALSRAVAVGAAIGVAVLVAIGPSPTDLATAIGDIPTGISQSSATLLHTGAVLWWLVLLCPVGLVAVAATRGWLPRPALGPALAAIVAFDMLAFAWGFQSTVPHSQFYKPVPGSVRFLQREQGTARITATYDNLPPDVGMHYGLRDVRGKDHPKPERMVELFRRAINPNQRATRTLGVPAVTDGIGHVLSMMGVRYLLTGPRETAPSAKSFEVAYRGPDAIVYRNRAALPRAYVAHSVRHASSPRNALDDVAAPTFNPRKTTVLESSAGGLDGPAPHGSARLTRDGAQHVDIAATLDRPGLVVLSDTYDRGWKPKVDGKPAEALRANYVYRAVRVPRGRHTIEWSYRPASFTLGAVTSALSLGLLLLLGGAAIIRRRPPRRSSPASPGRGPSRPALPSLLRRRRSVRS